MKITDLVGSDPETPTEGLIQVVIAIAGLLFWFWMLT